MSETPEYVICPVCEHAVDQLHACSDCYQKMWAKAESELPRAYAMLDNTRATVEKAMAAFAAACDLLEAHDAQQADDARRHWRREILSAAAGLDANQRP